AARRAQVGHALTPHAHHLAALGARGNAQVRGLVDRGNLDLVAESGLGDIDRQIEQQVVALAAEVAVRLDVEVQVAVAARAAGRTGLALTGQADLRAIVDARRHTHAQALGDLDAAPPTAGRARGGDDAPLAAAAIAHRHVNELAKHGLGRSSQLARAVAARTDAGLGARLNAATMAALTAVVPRDLEFLVAAEDGLLEGHRHLAAQVLATLRARAARARRSARAKEG